MSTLRLLCNTVSTNNTSLGIFFWKGLWGRELPGAFERVISWMPSFCTQLSENQSWRCFPQCPGNLETQVLLRLKDTRSHFNAEILLVLVLHLCLWSVLSGFCLLLCYCWLKKKKLLPSFQNVTAHKPFPFYYCDYLCLK